MLSPGEESGAEARWKESSMAAGNQGTQVCWPSEFSLSPNQFRMKSLLHALFQGRSPTVMTDSCNAIWYYSLIFMPVLFIYKLAPAYLTPTTACLLLPLSGSSHAARFRLFMLPKFLAPFYPKAPTHSFPSALNALPLGKFFIFHILWSFK